MFTCTQCQVEHPSDQDVGKEFDDGCKVCRICAYGHQNRDERRRAPKGQLCITPCWRKVAWDRRYAGYNDDVSTSGRGNMT